MIYLYFTFFFAHVYIYLVPLSFFLLTSYVRAWNWMGQNDRFLLYVQMLLILDRLDLVYLDRLICKLVVEAVEEGPEMSRSRSK